MIILYVTAYSAIQSLILSVKFFLDKKRNSTSIFTGLLLVVIAYDLVNSILYLGHFIQDYPHFLRVQTPLTFVYGPLLFLMIQSIITPSKFSMRMLYHAIPAIIVFIYFIPLYIQPASIKLDYIYFMFDGIQTDSYIFGFLRRFHIFIYLMIALPYLKDEHKHRNKIMWIWLGFLGVWLISMYRIFFDFEMMSALIDVIYINCVVIYLSYSISKTIHYTRIENTEERAELKQIMMEIEHFLINEKGFQDSLMSMKNLSNHLKLSQKKVSKAINEIKLMHFYDYINSIRISEAKKLIEKNMNQKIEDIAFSVGYNSISVFNTAFKKEMNCTPKHYQKLSNTRIQ